MTDLETATNLFEALWDIQEYALAVEIYESAGKPHWLAEQVALYHESMGRFEESIREWEHLLSAYFEIREDFLPLPDGPQELFLVGEWYASTDKTKAMRYLRLYLSAVREWGRDPAFYLRHKTEAQHILDQLSEGDCV